MQGNGYGPYDPFAQERRTGEYTNMNQRQQAPRPQQGSPRAQQQAYYAPQDAYAQTEPRRQAPPRQQMPQQPQQHAVQQYAAPRQDTFRQNVPQQAPRQQAPRQQNPQENFRQSVPQQAPRQPQYDQYDQGNAYDLDVANNASTPATPSRDMPFVAGGPKVKSAVIASVLALVIACGGFVTSRIKAQKAEDAAAQSTQQNVIVEEVEPSPIIPVEEAAVVTAVELNTTLPQFGSARLQITFTVDADAVVRVEILNADGSVFCVVEDAMEVTEGKLRTYFDGKDAQGNWIPVGNYQVRVSSLMAPEGADEEGTAAINWQVDNSKSVDFTVSADARPTQNSRPAIIATPTPSPSPSPSLTPDVSLSPDASQTTTPTPGTGQTTTPTPGASETATPTPATPTPATPTPDTGEGDAPPID